MRVIHSGISRFIFYVSILFAIILVFNCFVFGANQVEDIKETATTENVVLSDEEREILDLINEERIEYGLDKLEACEELQKVAKLKAEDLVNNEYFSHTSPTYGTPFEMLKNQGIIYTVAGENLAGNESGIRAVNAWMNSPAHKDNILDSDYKYTGISVVDSEVYGKVFVQLFMNV